MNLSRAIISALLVTFPLSHRAHADEQMNTLAENGNWVAMSHQETMVDHPDVCLVGNMESKFFMRADADTTEIRVANSAWSLPPKVAGSIDVAVGAFSQKLEIGSNTTDTVMARMDQAAFLDLLNAMDVSSSMKVVVGKYNLSVSLSGSTKVTNAFRNCASIDAGVKSPGANPFQ